MILLFIKIYTKKNLCIKLIGEFYQNNKYKKNEKNMNRKKDLNNYISTFSLIMPAAYSLPPDVTNNFALGYNIHLIIKVNTDKKIHKG